MAPSEQENGLSVAETHGIALRPGNRLIAHSDGKGWRNIYASFAAERPWSGTLSPVAHHCLVYCVSKTAKVRRAIDEGCRAESVVLTPRHLTIIPAGIASHWLVDGHPDILLLYLRRSMMNRMIEERFSADATRAEIIPRLAMMDPLLEQLALAALSLLQGEDDSALFYVDSLAVAIASRLVVRHMSGPGIRTSVGDRTPDVTNLRLKRVCDYIEAWLDKALTLNRLAEETDVSAEHLARAFRTKYGETLHHYVIRRRIERSKHLLRSTDMPIAEIAQATGFSSQSHLSALFQRSVGTSPGRYRRGR